MALPQGMDPQKIRDILGPNADEAFVKFLMQGNEYSTPGGLVAPTNVGAGLHNIGAYIASAGKDAAQRRDRMDMLKLLGSASHDNIGRNANAYRDPGSSSSSAGSGSSAPALARMPNAAPGPQSDFRPANRGDLSPGTPTGPGIADDVPPASPVSPLARMPAPAGQGTSVAAQSMLGNARERVENPPMPSAASPLATAPPSASVNPDPVAAPPAPLPGFGRSDRTKALRGFDTPPAKLGGPDPSPVSPLARMPGVPDPASSAAPFAQGSVQTAPASGFKYQPQHTSFTPQPASAQSTITSQPVVPATAQETDVAQQPQLTQPPQNEPRPPPSPMASRALTAGHPMAGGVASAPAPSPEVSRDQSVPVGPGQMPTQALQSAPDDVPPAPQPATAQPNKTGWAPKNVILHDYGGSPENRDGMFNPYHTLVFPDGSVRHRNPDDPYGSSAPHAAGMNPTSVGLSYAGQSGGQPTPAGLAALQAEHARIAQQFPGIRTLSHGEAYAETRGTPQQASRNGRGMDEAAWRTALGLPQSGSTQIADASGAPPPMPGIMRAGLGSLDGNTAPLEQGVTQRKVQSVPVGPPSAAPGLARMPSAYQPQIPDRTQQTPDARSHRWTPEQEQQWLTQDNGYNAKLMRKDPGVSKFYESRRPLNEQEALTNDNQRLANEKTRRELAQDPNKVGTLKDGEQLYRMNPQTGKVEWINPPDANGESHDFKKARDKELGETRAKGISTLPLAIDNAQLALKTLDDLESHPGRNGWSTGMMGQLPTMPGTEARGFANLLDQAKGKTFLEAFNSLRGGGAITEAEGSKATQALARLDRAQNKADFDLALVDLREVIGAGMKRAHISAGREKPVADGGSGMITAPATGATNTGAPKPKFTATNPNTKQKIVSDDGVNWRPAQ